MKRQQRENQMVEHGKLASDGNAGGNGSSGGSAGALYVSSSSHQSPNSGGQNSSPSPQMFATILFFKNYNIWSRAFKIGSRQGRGGYSEVFWSFVILRPNYWHEAISNSWSYRRWRINSTILFYGNISLNCCSFPFRIMFWIINSRGEHGIINCSL